MRVSEAMTRDVRVADPDQNICDVAKIMAECDVGSIPVGENDKLVGMITDRDITVRAVAQGKSPDATRVREIMTQDVKYCFEDEEISHVARNMGDIQVHRLPVVNADKRLVGIVSLADIAMCEGAEPAGQAVAGISTPTGSAGPTTGSSWSSQQQQQPSGSSQQLGSSRSRGAGGSQQQQQPSGGYQQPGSSQSQGIGSQQEQQPSGSYQQPGSSQSQGAGSSQQQQQPSGSRQPGSSQSPNQQQSSSSRRQQS